MDDCDKAATDCTIIDADHTCLSKQQLKNKRKREAAKKKKQAQKEVSIF